MNFVLVHKLKSKIKEDYGINLHFHDVCGAGVSFSLDEYNERIYNDIIFFLQNNNVKYTVSNDKKSFYIE